MSDTEPDDGQPRQDEDSWLVRADRELDWFRGPELGEVREQFSDWFSQVDWHAHGGWGLVYRARCRKTGEWLALKLLDPQTAVDEEAKRRFQREAKALQRLSDEHIVGIRYSGCRGRFHYIVMDFATGETLRDRLRVTALPQRKALRVALQIAKALRHAHGKGVIHRDLKPENVRIDARDEVKLVDFGIAKILDPGVDVSPLTAEGQAVGTGCYMAPEQRAGATVDHRADIFAVGVVLFEMLTGVKPEGRFELASQLVAGIDESVDRLLNTAMSRDPNERQANAAELCLELEQAIANVEAGLPSERAWTWRFWAACKQPCAVAVALATTAAGVWNACDPWVHRWPLAEFAGTSLGTIAGFQITWAGILLLLAVVIAWVVVLRSPDSSLMRRLPNRGPHDPARRFFEDLRAVREKLVKTLEELNIDLDWTDALYEPIEAEVEVSRGGRSQRRLRDVVSALRAERRRRVLLLVGYPGSGKSVILRHLAIKLLTTRREVRTGRIPIYVDLKGWKPAEEWTRDAPPTERQLQDFVRHAILECLDEQTASFLHQHFEQFLEQGRFFFLLDSFDEIPAIQDVADGSWLVRELSNVVWKFLNGAHESRGVVASRPFRQPKFNNAAPELATLTLRDFDDWRIHQALLRSPKIKEQEARSFFLAGRLPADPEELDLDCIPQNSGYRDALVLYAEVADERTARHMAEFCWEKIKAADEAQAKPSDLLYVEALHCLRFLGDTFGTRLDCLSGFQTNLADYVCQRIEPGGDLLAAKHAVEAAGLLPPERLAELVGPALQHPSEWIKETALRACRRLSRLSRQIEFSVKEYLAKIPVGDFLRRSKELQFALSLSAAFSGVRTFCSLRTVSTWLSISACAALFVFAPMLAAGVLLVAATLTLLGSALVRLFGAVGNHWTTPLLGLFQSFGTAAILLWLFVACVLPIRDRLLHLVSVNPDFTPALRSYDQIRGLVVPFMRSLLAETPPPHGQPWDGLLMGAAILMLLAFRPFHDWMLTIERSPTRWRERRRKAAKTVAKIRENPVDALRPAIPTLLAWCLAGAMIPLLIYRPELYAIMLAVLMGLSLFLMWLGTLAERRHDRRLLREAMSQRVVTRQEIESVLEALHSPASRLRYVVWLRDSPLKLLGLWTSSLPNFDDDAASTLLAQLEERWLGLDR